ncbi:MAG: asparaginase domain-containing protein [Nanoarchaeota archaeon]|nr:asparaginase domain-containing protein [Nanoarchaeota archaeon]
MRKKILFLYNGGTIGQVPEKKEDGSSVLVPPKNSEVFRIACEPIINELNQDSEIIFEHVTSKDSTNMTPNDWEKLIFRIKKAQEEEKYDGVAIAHGTDTLAYTSTALSLALHGKYPTKTGLKIPICITGAQNPIYQPGGDGRFNLENLFRTLNKAIDTGIADVMVNFWDKVFLGSRILKVSEKDFDAFNSPSFPPVGTIDAKGVTLDTRLLKKKSNAEDKIMLAPKFGRGVISFELTPGTDPNVVLGFITNGGISALILKSLGEGNVCNEGQYNLIPVIKQASEEYLTPIFITTKFVSGGAGAAHYSTGYEPIKAGGIPCYDHTDIAVDVKVRWLIGNSMCSSIEDYKKAMKTSYAGEVTAQL